MAALLIGTVVLGITDDSEATRENFNNVVDNFSTNGIGVALEVGPPGISSLEQFFNR